LGTDAERATFRALHSATAAGAHLRSGLIAAGALKLDERFRALLNCAVFAMTDEEERLAWERTGTSARPVS